MIKSKYVALFNIRRIYIFKEIFILTSLRVICLSHHIYY